MLNVVTTRLTKGSTGAIKASPGRLAWLIVSNEHGSNKRACKLNDATSGTGNELGEFWCPPQATKVFPFDPPIPCNTGIYIGTNDNVVVTGGYD